MTKNAINFRNARFFYLNLVWSDEQVGRDKNASILVLFFYLSLVWSDEKVDHDKKRHHL